MTESMCHVHSWIKIQSGHFLKRERGIFNSEVVPPTSPGTSSLTLPALLHKRGRRRKGKAKVRLRGNVPPVWDPADPGQRLEVCWWDGASRGPPPAAGQRGTEGLQPGTVSHRPLHSPPRVGCTRLIPLFSHQSLREMFSPPPAQPPRWQWPPKPPLGKAQSCHLWVTHY